jgi:hypothetical protein
LVDAYLTGPAELRAAINRMSRQQSISPPDS